MNGFTRSFPLLDLAIRSGGDGRTVEAYAAVFDTPVHVVDAHGEYREQITRTAFNKTIADRGTKPWPVLFNHGLTVHGTPSAMDSMPIGASIEPPRADSRGVVTVSRYHVGERADQVLEAIRSGAVSAQSFSGSFKTSTPRKPAGGYRPNRAGELTLVTRTEIAMEEYGPAVFAAYPDAVITSVRVALQPDETTLLTSLLVSLAASDAAIDPIVEALCSADCALGDAQTAIAAILGLPDPEAEDDMGDAPMTQPMTAMASANLTTLARRLDAAIAARASGTPHGAAAEEPGTAHSGRLILPAERIARVRRAVMGITPGKAVQS